MGFNKSECFLFFSFHGASVEKLPKCDEETELKIKPE